MHQRARAKENARSPHWNREKEKEKVRKESHPNVQDPSVRTLVLAKEVAKPDLRTQLAFVAISKATDMYRTRPELSPEADLHQVKLTVRSAELISKVTVQKGPSVESGTSPTVNSTSEMNVEQEISASSTIAIRMARSSMAVMLTLQHPNQPQSRRRDRRRRRLKPRLLGPLLLRSAMQRHRASLLLQYNFRRWNSKAAET